MRLFVYKKKFKVIFLFIIGYKMKIIIIYFIYLFTNINSFEFSKSKYNSVILHKEINNHLNEIINNDNKIKLFNSPNQDWALDCLKFRCIKENIYYNIISYENFYNNNYCPDNKLTIIDDFMINYGRTLTINEKENILNYNKNSNLIFYINDYNNLVLKDNQFMKNFKMFNFPYIQKTLLNNYIFDLIDYYNYDNRLQLINWKKYKIEKLNFGKLEDLIYKLHLFLVFNRDNFKYLENILEEELSYLDKKYYD